MICQTMKIDYFHNDTYIYVSIRLYMSNAIAAVVFTLQIAIINCHNPGDEMKLQSEDNAASGNYASVKAMRAEDARHHPSEQHEPPALSLDDRGMILDCSKSFGKLLGFQRSDLVWQHVSTLFPQLAGVELVQAGHVNSLLSYLCRCGKLYQAKNRQGDFLSINLSFVRIQYKGKGILRLIAHPPIGGECNGVA